MPAVTCGKDTLNVCGIALERKSQPKHAFERVLDIP
jgi:hypothetical protein